jgi:broad specificity phosphatase PhoE
MRLLVARHGATLHNEERRVTGQIDAPLSALGQRQADALGERLAGARFDAIVASDLSRALETAEAVARRVGLPVIVDPDLREISMGAWEGRVYDDLVSDEHELLKRIEMDSQGGWGAPNGENWSQFSERVHGALARWQRRYPAGNLLWVTHGGVVSVLLLRALGLSFERRSQFRRDNASLFEFDFAPDGAKIVRANDVAHLERIMAVGTEMKEQVL